MKVVSVAYPFAPVSADTAGGAEQVLWMIDEALSSAGHESIVVAAAGSRVCGRLVESCSVPEVIDHSTRERVQDAHKTIVETVLRQECPDLLHLHGVDFHTYLPETTVPVLVTLHLPFSWYASSALSAPVLFNCVSEAQYRTKPSRIEVLGWIDNGVPIRKLRSRVRKRKFALAMGRVCEEKGLHLAMEAAAAAGTFLMVGGQLFGYETHKRYFESEIEPRLREDLNRFIGPLSFARKRRLMSAASCFVQPSQAQETSSLTTMEALACGTPVVSFASGALPSMIEPGKTGFVVSDTESMARAIQDAPSLGSEGCRRVAEERFDARRMCADYLALYERITGAGRIATRKPRFEDEWRELWAAQNSTPFQSPDWLLPWMEHVGGGTGEMRDFRRSGKLVGVLPMQRWDGKWRLLGEGITDYLDAVGDVELPSEPFEFTNVPRWSSLVTGACAEPSDPCLTVRLPATWDEYLSSLPPKLRQNVRKMDGHVRSLGPEGIEILFDLHAGRWRRQGEAGVLDDSSIRAFHRDVANRFHQRGMLRLNGVFMDSRCVGVAYGFQWQERLYFYLGGFDPEYSSLSPGSLAIGCGIRGGIQAGVRTVDFLRGAEPYKRRWGAVETQTYRLAG